MPLDVLMILVSLPPVQGPGEWYVPWTLLWKHYLLVGPQVLHYKFAAAFPFPQFKFFFPSNIYHGNSSIFTLAGAISFSREPPYLEFPPFPEGGGMSLQWYKPHFSRKCSKVNRLPLALIFTFIVSKFLIIPL